MNKCCYICYRAINYFPFIKSLIRYFMKNKIQVIIYGLSALHGMTYAQQPARQSTQHMHYSFSKLPLGDLSPVKKNGAYVYQDSIFYTQTINFKTLSFGKDGIAYEAFDMPAYPGNNEMARHFSGLEYHYRVNGNNIAIEYVYKRSDNRLHNNYLYGTIDGDVITLTHESSGKSKRKRPLPRKKVYVYDDTLTAKPSWQK